MGWKKCLSLFWWDVYFALSEGSIRPCDYLHSTLISSSNWTKCLWIFHQFVDQRRGHESQGYLCQELKGLVFLKRGVNGVQIYEMYWWVYTVSDTFQMYDHWNTHVSIELGSIYGFDFLKLAIHSLYCWISQLADWVIG